MILFLYHLFNTEWICVGKAIAINLLIVKIKEIIDGETNDIYATNPAIGSTESNLVALFHHQSIVFHQNIDYSRNLARWKITETRPLI